MASSGEDSVFDLPADFVALGALLIEQGRGDQAVELARRALAARPGDRRIEAAAHAIFARSLPSYHRAMLADEARNDAYRTAIERFAPGKRVLDIGTGSGLLAMMAARAGAEHVYACDENPVMADAAREIIAVNGFADRITVIGRESRKLDREAELDGGVDLVVSELISSNAVSEGLLQSLRHAASELIRPGAIFLPNSVSVIAALADHPALAEVGDVAGFDLSAMNLRLPWRQPLDTAEAAAAQRSAGVVVAEFRFAEGEEIPRRGELQLELGSHGGRVNGIMQWVHFSFAPDISYENAPGSGLTRHWKLVFTPFSRPRETDAGERIAVGALFHDGEFVMWDAG